MFNNRSYLSLISAAFALSLVMAPPTAKAQSKDSPVGFASAQVKAAFLYRLPKFIRWPDGRVASHFCFDEQSVVFETFRLLLEAKNATATVSLIAPKDQAERCDVFFTSSRPGSDVSPNQLLVSDVNNFANDGGMIELTRRGSRLAMSINVESLSSGNLTASSQLLKLATSVKGASEQGG